MADSNQDDEEPGRRYPKRNRKCVVKELFTGTFTKTSHKTSKGDSSASSSQQKVLKSWKPEDQEKFEPCLETYGDQDVALLASKIQHQQKTPSPTTVYNYLQKHKDFVSGNDETKLPRLLRLKKWLECIKDKKVKMPQPNPTALSMLLISLLEDHPVPTDSEVNFAEAYEYLFELLSGRNFVRHTKHLERKYSEPTLKFIRLTVLSLLNGTLNKMDVLQKKFVQSANDPTTNKKLDHLPDHIQQILQISHFNPLNLNEDALTIDEASGPVICAPGTSDTASDMADISPVMPDTDSVMCDNFVSMLDTASGMTSTTSDILDIASGSSDSL